MKGLMGLLGSLMGGMKDDKGLFQGGEEGRVGGRFRDMLQGKSTSYDPGMEEDNELAVHARDFAKNMDVGNKEDVFEMQSMLAKLGIGDFEGKQLKADGIMGDRTTSALRLLQGQDYEEGESSPEESFDYEPGKDPSGPIDPWAETEGESTMMRNRGETGNSVMENMKKLFFRGAGGMMNERIENAVNNLPKHAARWKDLTNYGRHASTGPGRTLKD